MFVTPTNVNTRRSHLKLSEPYISVNCYCFCKNYFDMKNYNLISVSKNIILPLVIYNRRVQKSPMKNRLSAFFFFLKMYRESAGNFCTYVTVSLRPAINYYTRFNPNSPFFKLPFPGSHWSFKDLSFSMFTFLYGSYFESYSF